MKLKDILAISGMPGLYKVVAQAKNGVIVESLIDKKRFPAFSSHKISSLEDIIVYTSGDDTPLKDIFKSISEKHNGGPSIDTKIEDKKIRAYFEEVLPTFDKERVYTSDIKKLINWYNLLQKNNLLIFEDEKPVEEVKEEKKEKAEGKTAKEKKAPKAETAEKKAAPKKKAPKKED
ncbi:MAG: DUF5606 domain-containing protein [Bacteroidetes bacterium]|nr:DUF5606 domain-containing protein [Bacteroidota bacterium]